MNESVVLCRKSGFSSACGLVNAVLRKLSAGEVASPEVNVESMFQEEKNISQETIDALLELG